MATVSATAQAYAGGSATSSKLIGYSYSANRVVRYSFKTGADGASKLSFSFQGPASPTGSTTAATIFWFVTDSSTSHISAGMSAEKNGVCAASYNSSSYAFTISVSAGAVKLLPNTNYYLYLFPGHDSSSTYLTINSAWATTMDITLEGVYKAQTLTLQQGEGTTLTVTKNGTALADGAVVYTGDQLTVSFSALTGYTGAACVVSGVGSLSSGGSFSVSANHTVTVTAERKSYTLTISADSHGAVTVMRSGESLKSGDTLRHFDQLLVTASAKNGFKVTAADLNGTVISPDTAVSHTVSGPVTVTVLTEALSGLFIDEAGERKRFLVYIDRDGERKQYRMLVR